MEPPAHKILIEQYLDWEKVYERLNRYKHIGKQYPISYLKKCSDSSPFYCHYLAWRLGTWMNEELFKFLDDLFATGASLNKWNSKRSQLKSCSFDDFWGLIWELQIAKLFCGQEEVKVEWMNQAKGGPDLKANLGGKTFFVECFTYRKSFGIEAFIEELYNHVHQKIRVKHVLCVQFRLPNDAASLEVFLDELFRPCLDKAYLQSKLKEAQFEYPILLPIPNSAKNFYVYVEGNDHRNFVPGRVPMSMGDNEAYLKHAIEDALNKKRGENRLIDHHPNLLAVNYLLDKGFQTALNRQRNLGLKMPTPEFDSTFDMVLFAACGIDEIPPIHSTYLAVRPGQEHNAMRFMPAGQAESSADSKPNKTNAADL